MAVFVAGTDESSVGTGSFYWCGFIAPESDWSQFFAPAWQERVLDGPPKIPYLHMTDIMSPAWQIKNGISRKDAQRRLDEAFDIIRILGSLYPVGLVVDAGHFRKTFEDVKIAGRIGRAPYEFEPDYLCFGAFAMWVVAWVAEYHPSCEKVDFLVERNGPITKRLTDFHDQIESGLVALGHPELTNLVGELIPGGKDRVPLQAADLLCWHEQRYAAGLLDPVEYQRYGTIATRHGFKHTMTHDEIEAMVQRAKAEGITIPDKKSRRLMP